jgi:hypothetical protein
VVTKYVFLACSVSLQKIRVHLSAHFFSRPRPNCSIYCPGFFYFSSVKPTGSWKKAAIANPIAYKGIFDCRPAATEGNELFLSTIECESCKVPQSDDLIARVHTTCRDKYTRPDRKLCRGFHAANTFAQDRRLSVPNKKKKKRRNAMKAKYPPAASMFCSKMCLRCIHQY